MSMPMTQTYIGQVLSVAAFLMERNNFKDFFQNLFNHQLVKLFYLLAIYYF